MILCPSLCPTALLFTRLSFYSYIYCPTWCTPYSRVLYVNEIENSPVIFLFFFRFYLLKKKYIQSVLTENKNSHLHNLRLPSRRKKPFRKIDPIHTRKKKGIWEKQALSLLSFALHARARFLLRGIYIEEKGVRNWLLVSSWDSTYQFLPAHYIRSQETFPFFYRCPVMFVIDLHKKNSIR